ncbi:MAG: dihydrofolate reductase family protein [Chitinophagaceae bacterium]
MGKIVSFMHISLDGFVAGTSGEMDWIHVDDEIFDYVGDRTDQSDTALYGRGNLANDGRLLAHCGR